MRVNPLYTLTGAISVVAYSLKDTLISFLLNLVGQGHQKQPPISTQPVALSSVLHFAAPKIDISQDCLDFSRKNLSLEDMQQLDIKVQNNPFIGHIIWGTLPSGPKADELRNNIEQKVMQNNAKYQRYPSDFVHGLLSAHAYQIVDQDGIDVTFADEKHSSYEPYFAKWLLKYKRYEPYLATWRVNSVHYLPEYGDYYAASYFNTDTRQLVLAHRGTPASIDSALSSLFKTNSPLKTDIDGVLKGEIVDQQKAAYDVTQAVANFAKENNYHFSTTGHSLGAWLTEFSLYYSVFNFNIPAKAVTFDSPGSIAMEDSHSTIFNHLETRDIRDLDITTYLSDPNFVNTCHLHFGNVYRLYPRCSALDHAKQKGTIFAGFLSLFAHDLAGLIATFDPTTGKPKKFDYVAKWPLMTYTPQQQFGVNMLTYLFRQMDIFGITSQILRTVLATVSGKEAQDSKETNLITSCSRLVADVLCGRIDQQKYIKYWQLLIDTHVNNAPPPPALFNSKEFEFKYKANYALSAYQATFDLLRNHLIGSADWYLKELKDCPPKKIEQKFGEGNLITQQLIDLQGQYRIDVENKNCPTKYHKLTTENITVEAVRERILRLLSEHVTNTKVTSFLKAHRTIILQMSTEPELPSYLPLSLDSQYIFRADDIDQMDRIDQLLDYHPYLILCGEPGFGKTSFAMEYGRRQDSHPHHAKIAYTIPANSQEKIDEAYHSMAYDLKIFGDRAIERVSAETIRSLVHSQISRGRKKVLLIFDNVENAEHIKPCLASLPKNAKALITTNHSRLMEGKPAIKVRPFNYDEAKQYIYASDIKGRINDEQEVEALIAHYVKGTDAVAPYHLNLAIGIIKQKPIGGIKNYLNFIKAHPVGKGEILLLQKLLAKSKLAWPMLQYAAFLDPDFIDLSLFEKVFNVDRNDLVGAIDALESLSAMNVVRRDGQDGLSLQRLTQRIAKALIDKPPLKVNCLLKIKIMSQLANSLNTLCPRVTDTPGQDWSQAKKLMPHIEAVLAYGQDIDDENLVAELWSKEGAYAEKVLGLDQKALEHYQEALKHYQKAQMLPRQGLDLKKVQRAVAYSLDNVGTSYVRLGGEKNVKKGLKLLEQSLTMWQTLYPSKQAHPGVANCLDDLGLAYRDLGGVVNIQTGLKYKKQALAMRRELYPNNQPNLDVAMSLHNVGYGYVKLGEAKNINEGIDLIQQALQMLQTPPLNGPSPGIAFSLHHLGSAYIKLGGAENVQKGLKYQEDALKMRQTLYPNQPHPDVAASLNKVGNSYVLLKGKDNKEKGLVRKEQALNMLQALYPDQAHPAVATLLHEVGLSYANLDGVESKKKGLDLLRQSLQMRKQLPDCLIVKTFNSLGKLLIDLGQEEEGKQYLKRAEEMQQKLEEN